MKNLFLTEKSSAQKSKKLFLVWICFTAAVFLTFAVSLLFSPNIKFGTSLFDILSPSSNAHEFQKADTALAEKTGRTITILVKNSDFDAARNDARKLYEIYEAKENIGFFEELSLFVDTDSVEKINKWISDWKFNLLDQETIELLENGGEEEFAMDSFGRIFGMFTISDLAVLAEDPFLLGELEFNNFLKSGVLNSTAMSLKDDVLACQKDGDWYVLIRGTISKSGASLTNRKSAVKSIYKNCAYIEKNTDSEFVFSGIPFHSYDNSSSAQTQISIISTVALVAILVIFFLIFGSFLPALVSALAVVFSCASGFVSVLLFFRGIHVLTFVFGTTLIGTCLDYSIHFFINWKYNTKLSSGEEIRKHIFKGVGLGFASTEICFAALFFSPFPLLRQVSVFLFTGLAASFLSVICLYQFFRLPENRKSFSENRFFVLRRRFRTKYGKISVAVSVCLALFALTVIFVKKDGLKIYNNISTLYSMTGKMMQSEIVSAKVLDTGSSGWYFILKAESKEELLEKGEELDSLLEKSVTDGKMKSFLSVTQFVPSEKRQKRSYKSLEKAVPLAKINFDQLGFSENDYEKFLQAYKNAENIFFGVDSLPEMLASAVKSIYIGEIDGEFYSCVMPLHTDSACEPEFRSLADSIEGLYFVNKTKDISAQLDLLSRTMLIMLGIAFVVIICILFFVYRPLIVLKISLIPVLVVLVTIAALLLADIPLSFFPITSLVLVFGLGLDYIIYEIEGADSKSDLNDFAVLLSFVTTVLSFGALIFSSFPPVFMLGFTVSAGLFTAVFSAFTIIEKKE